VSEQRPANRPSPLPGTPGHPGDISTRFAMGVLMIAVASAAVYFGGWPFRALVLVGAGIMLAEWAEMHKVAWLWTWLGVLLLAVLLLGGVEYFYSAGEADAMPLGYGEEMEAIDAGTFLPVLYLIGAAAAGGLLLALLSRRLTLGWGFFYVAVPSVALLVLSWVDYTLVFWAMIVTWSTDIFAYFAGRGIGGPKLAPRVSPNKTWAGLIGGMVAAALFGGLWVYLLQLPSILYLLAAPFAVAAQLGDLFESWLKRRAGVKDSGTWLPGHGGALDRLDGLVVVAILTAAAMMAGWL